MERPPRDDDLSDEDEEADPLDEQLRKEIRKVHDDDAAPTSEDGDDEEETPGKDEEDTIVPAKYFRDDPLDYFAPQWLRQRIAKIFGYTLQGINTLGNVLWFGFTTGMVLLIPIYYVFSIATAGEQFNYEPSRETEDFFLRPGQDPHIPTGPDTTFGATAAAAAESAAATYTNTVRPNPNLPQ